MTIQINGGDDFENSERATVYFTEMVTKELDRFAELLTRVEVHFSDINGAKGGPDDKKCVIEARMKHRDPVAATAQDDKPEKAFRASLSKVKASMTTIVGKMQEKR